ncbi:helix-turn-helix domain-containing protein [Nannocystis sp. SCPEA4]|uniref:helix-turn-helix domain-containing protein n=1 Tax=Nannocystis sp. SCPEA4 TaxID=2996787 RepID=UPI00226F3D28|nr:helix-turn-helix domain-containing protein [Nannocystis sp. SCPEA4]MCY1060731.1 helix-turn-helix domain-containing protein [Nannocystis sp. SCPEA4]
MSAETTLPEYIGSSEAMKITGFSRTTFYRRVKDGDIPCVRAIHRWIFHRETLIAWREKLLAPSRSVP